MQSTIQTAPNFVGYICVGDSQTWTQEGYTFTARIYEDLDSNPTDFDCFNAVDIEQWENDEWYFCGIILSVAKNGVLLDDHAASIWGVDCNFGDNSAGYLNDLCMDLASEAVQVAKEKQQEIIRALSE